MRTILSAAEMAEKEKKRKRIGGIVIIALLVLSSLGFALSSVSNNNQSEVNEEGLNYNGQYWVYSLGEQKYYFTYHTSEINTSLIGLTKTLGDFSNRQVYIDSQIGGGLQEIYNSLGIYASKVVEACYGKCERDLPEKECAPGGEILLVLRENETSRISEENNCVFLNGDLKTVDAFLYRVLGIN